MSTLERAIEIAHEAHKSQTDKAGRPYIEHPLRVMAAGKTLDEKITGILHDVVEDSNITFDYLIREGFSHSIIEALRCITKTSAEEPYDHFIARIKKNPLATAVKLNDLTDNMDIRRLPYISDKDVKRLKKYLKAYKFLTGEPRYSIEACKQEYPNAYNPWSDEEDAALTNLLSQGKSTDEIAEILRRKPGGIHSRIKKLHL